MINALSEEKRANAIIIETKELYDGPNAFSTASPPTEITPDIVIGSTA